jgi:hypothetical protein
MPLDDLDFTLEAPRADWFRSVSVDDPERRACYGVTVPARSDGEALAYLLAVAGGIGGAGSRMLLAGSTAEMIRAKYNASLARIEAEIARRQTLLGPKPDAAALREFADWAVRQRTRIARVWRIPSGPEVMVVAEVRDWAKYGAGGRTLNNLLEDAGRREGVTGVAALERVLKSATRSNKKITEQLVKSVRFLRHGGAALSVLGIGLSAAEVCYAPPERRVGVAGEALAGFVGGAAVGGLVTAILVFAGPPGWVVIGVGFLAGITGGIAGEAIYRANNGPQLMTQLQLRGYVTADGLGRFCP